MRRAIQKDIDLIKDPASWPRWPELCMKRYVGKDEKDLEIGFIRAVKGELTTIWIVNIYAMADGTVKFDPKTSPKIVYPNLDALLDDG